MPKVSILIPTYNVEKYLCQCMDSVIHQTLKDIEIIAINDGSTDHSLEILKNYAAMDSRVRILSGPNGGYGKAMNKGLDAATGEYIGIVEPDDYVPETMYEDLYAQAAKHDLDFIKADFYRFVTTDDGTEQLTYVHISRSGRGYNQVLWPYDHLEVFKFVLNTWSGIYKREFLNKYQIRHHETPGASYQDNGFWFKTFTQAQRVMFLDKAYYKNRRDNPNSSVHSKSKVYCMNEEFALIRKFMEEKPSILEHFIGVYHFKQYHNYAFTYQRVGEEFKKEYAIRFAQEMQEAITHNELDESLFSPRDLRTIQMLVEDPLRYYYWNSFGKELEEQQKELDRLRKEVKYIEKFRHSFLFPPVKKLVHKLRK